MKLIFQLMFYLLICHSGYTQKDTTIISDLGNGYFFSLNNTASKIYYLPYYNKKKVADSTNPKTIWVLTDSVISVGNNTSHILVITEKKNSNRYLHINKTIEPEELFNDEKENISLKSMNWITKQMFLILQQKYKIPFNQ